MPSTCTYPSTHLHNTQQKNPGGKQVLTGPELADLYKDLAAKYPIVSIEDPFDQVGVSVLLSFLDCVVGHE